MHRSVGKACFWAKLSLLCHRSQHCTHRFDVAFFRQHKDHLREETCPRVGNDIHRQLCHQRIVGRGVIGGGVVCGGVIGRLEWFQFEEW